MTAKDDNPFEGMGVAGGLMAGAGLMTWAPDFFEANGTVRLVWYVPAVLLGLTGFFGTIIEVGKLRKGRSRAGLDDIGLGLFFAVAAGGFYWIQRSTEMSSPFLGLMKTVVLLLAFIAAVGVFLGAGRYLGDVAHDPERARGDSAEQRERRARFTAEVLGLLAALASLAAAVVSVVQVTAG